MLSILDIFSSKNPEAAFDSDAAIIQYVEMNYRLREGLPVTLERISTEKSLKAAPSDISTLYVCSVCSKDVRYSCNLVIPTCGYHGYCNKCFKDFITKEF